MSNQLSVTSGTSQHHESVQVWLERPCTSVGPARAAILSGPVPSAQGFLAPTESPKIFWSPIFGFPETLEKGVSRLNLHFVGLPRSQKQGRRCRQTNPLCATDSPDDCRHFDVFHVTIEFPRIMGTEIFKKIYPCRKHKKRFPVDEKFIRHREPCQINYL